LTFILPITNSILDDFKSDDKVAIRIPRSKILRDFIDKIGKPIISTSVNISGEPVINDIFTIEDKFNDWFDYCLYDANEPAGVISPSTIITYSEYFKEIICVREGVLSSREIIESFTAPLIQFVCVGNICRSPMAEYYFRHCVEENNLSYRSASSGVYAASDYYISKHSKSLLEANNIFPSDKYGMQINSEIVRKSAIILVMTEEIKTQIIYMFPLAEHKIFTLAEISDNIEDIEDPYGENYDFYKSVFAQIKKYCNDFIKVLIKL
jgi:protein-tyrosine-phosphatase